MVCCRYINVNTLHKGDNKDNNKTTTTSTSKVSEESYITACSSLLCKLRAFVNWRKEGTFVESRRNLVHSDPESAFQIYLDSCPLQQGKSKGSAPDHFSHPKIERGFSIRHELRLSSRF
jgi:hypothetical protein